MTDIPTFRFDHEKTIEQVQYWAGISPVKVNQALPEDTQLKAAVRGMFVDDKHVRFGTAINSCERYRTIY
jgi:hypothetical protein